MLKLRIYLVFLLSTAIYLAFRLVYNVGMINSLLFLGMLYALPAFVLLVNNEFHKELKIINGEINSMQNKKTEHLSRFGERGNEKKYLEQKLIDLSKLYAITKEMSFNIRFGGLLDSLKSFLEDNFRFGNFKIVLFRHENGSVEIEKIAQVSPEVKDDIELDEALRNFSKGITKSKKFNFFVRGQDLFNLGFKESVKNILAIPLIVRRRVIAAILIENINEKERDSFLILASQVALQIERIKLFENVEKLSITDGLTGVFLRRYFLSRLKEEVARVRQYGMKLAFIMMDLDYFKRCNDSSGHLVGDVVLRSVTDILKKNVREIDLVGRYGGEEFCVLLPDADKKGALIVAERVRKAVEDFTITAYDESVSITISMGISSFPEDSETLVDLIENADKALYEAKRRGRNRVCLAEGG